MSGGRKRNWLSVFAQPLTCQIWGRCLYFLQFVFLQYKVRETDQMVPGVTFSLIPHIYSSFAQCDHSHCICGASTVHELRLLISAPAEQGALPHLTGKEI